MSRTTNPGRKCPLPPRRLTSYSSSACLIGGSYAPGAQLKEEHLARELDISRTPVRVAEWIESDIQETCHLRGLLEGRAAELAAQRGGPALAQRLHVLNERMEAVLAKGRPGVAARAQEINAGFHRAIMQASASPRLRGLLAGLIDMPVVVQSFFISTPQNMAQSQQNHRDLTAAVEARDAELARLVMRLHLRVAAQRFQRRRAEFASRTAPAGAPGQAPGPVLSR